MAMSMEKAGNNIRLTTAADIIADDEAVHQVKQTGA
jgi:hypothetical protein